MHEKLLTKSQINPLAYMGLSEKQIFNLVSTLILK